MASTVFIGSLRIEEGTRHPGRGKSPSFRLRPHREPRPGRVLTGPLASRSGR